VRKRRRRGVRVERGRIDAFFTPHLQISSATSGCVLAWNVAGSSALHERRVMLNVGRPIVRIVVSVQSCGSRGCADAGLPECRKSHA
jgi:hypothetical protein